MNASDSILAFLIIIIFIIIFALSILLSGGTNIANNWNKYKCDPAILPFTSYICTPDSNCAWYDKTGEYAPKNIKDNPALFSDYKRKAQTRPAWVQMKECISEHSDGKIHEISTTHNNTLNNMSKDMYGVLDTFSDLQDIFSEFIFIMKEAVMQLNGSLQQLAAGSSRATQQLGGAMQQSSGALSLFNSVGDASMKSVADAWNRYPGQFVRHINAVSSTGNTKKIAD